MNHIYDINQETDVYAKDCYYYLLNRQKLRSQLQTLKNEELTFLGFRRLFVLAERSYEEQCGTTKLLRKNPKNS